MEIVKIVDLSNWWTTETYNSLFNLLLSISWK